MRTDWTPLRKELALWRSEGLVLPLWWRDDDAVRETAALHQLLEMGEAMGLPLALAIIPKAAESTIAQLCLAHPWARALVHGWQHENHAPAGQKKAEFGQPRPALEKEAALGLTHLTGLLGDKLLPVFVPPWNRIAPQLIPKLPAMGYRALSTFTPRQRPLAAPGLMAINTHIDPINWRGGGGLVPEEVLIARIVNLLQDRREGHTDRSEPLGLLTHHLVHDDPVWSFTRALLEELISAGAQPIDIREILAGAP